MTNTTRHTTIHTVTAAACLGWAAASLTCGNLTETLAGLTAATTAWAAAAWRDKQTRHRHHMKTGRETVWARRETEPRVDRGRLYTTGPGCQGCVMTKRHLDRRGIRFTQVRLDDDENIALAARYLGFTTAPVVFVATRGGSEQHWQGYRPDRIDALAAGS